MRPATENNGLGDNAYVIENRCRAYDIAVDYVLLDRGCDKQVSSNMAIPANRWIADYSYCETEPEITGARFTK